MNFNIARIGNRLRHVYRSVTERPLNWRMIDAFVRLEEREENDGEIVTRPLRPDKSVSDGRKPR